MIFNGIEFGWFEAGKIGCGIIVYSMVTNDYI
jgi:hypothetical protein